MLFFLNDKAEYNNIYRRSLIFSVESNLGKKVHSLGTFDRPFSFFRIILLNFKKSFVVSSNLKSNCVALILYWGALVVIVNGLGRYRNRSSFRGVFRFLLDFRYRNTKPIFQNYADYRFYRRFCKRAKVYWVPGSGGVARDVGNTPENYIAVQRDSKIGLVANSLREFSKLVREWKPDSNPSFIVVGCTSSENLFQTDLISFKSAGRYAQNKIFTDGKSFIQPEGYGEGIPHTLVDAICSGMNIFIKKRCFLRYGLYRLNCKFEPKSAGWGELILSEFTEKSLDLHTVNFSYLQVINEILKGDR